MRLPEEEEEDMTMVMMMVMVTVMVMVVVVMTMTMTMMMMKMTMTKVIQLAPLRHRPFESREPGCCRAWPPDEQRMGSGDRESSESGHHSEPTRSWPAS